MLRGAASLSGMDLAAVLQLSINSRANIPASIPDSIQLPTPSAIPAHLSHTSPHRLGSLQSQPCIPAVTQVASKILLVGNYLEIQACLHGTAQESAGLLQEHVLTKGEAII